MSAARLSILVVDDEKLQRETLAAILADQGHRTRTAQDVPDAAAALAAEPFDVVLTDFRIPGGSGLDVAARATELAPDAVTLVMTAYADVQSVIEALRLGVADYLQKPLDVPALLARLAVLAERRAEARAASELRRQLQRPTDAGTMLGESEAIRAVRSVALQVAATRGTVLITGESGTGKEVAARLVHGASRDAAQRFVAVNCGALPETLLESELFGHKKGAFTGAYQDKPGLFTVASEGTLFLDEIGEMPKSLQVKLLRALQEREVYPLGDTRPVKVSLRIVAATNRDLGEAVRAGAFRQDLYYRINVVELRMPPLRERRDDIPVLARHFVQKYARELQRRKRGLSTEALRALLSYDWPGNVRELENVIERALILGGDAETVELRDLPPILRGGGGECERAGASAKLDDAVRQFTLAHIAAVLAAHGGDKRDAARALGISLSSLYRKLEEAQAP